MKEYIRTIGVDDAAFDRAKSRKAFVFGVIVRGNSIIEGILRTEVTVDGLDATEKISLMIKNSKFCPQLKAIFLASSTIAAFNIIDLHRLSNETHIPVVTILKKKPDNNIVRKALAHLDDGEKRFQILMNNPSFEAVKVNINDRNCNIYIQRVNISYLELQKLIKLSTKTSCIPESLRIADMIGKTFAEYIIH